MRKIAVAALFIAAIVAVVYVLQIGDRREPSSTRQEVPNPSTRTTDSEVDIPIRSAVRDVRSGSPPEGSNGAGIMVDGTHVFAHLVGYRPDYQTAERFTGEGYAFLTLTINNTDGMDKYSWNCNTDGVSIELSGERTAKSVDISDMKGFERWRLASDFSCTRTVDPGDDDALYLAFSPSFSWEDVRSVTFHIGELGSDGVKADWVRVKPYEISNE